MKPPHIGPPRLDSCPAFWTIRGLQVAAERLRKLGGDMAVGRVYDRRHKGDPHLPNRSTIHRILGPVEAFKQLPPPEPDAPWAREEDRYLLRCLPAVPLSILAPRIGRSPRAIRRRLKRLRADERLDVVPCAEIDRDFGLPHGTTRRLARLGALGDRTYYGIPSWSLATLVTILDATDPGWKAGVSLDGSRWWHALVS
jgi:hypothetical protein